MAQTWTDWEAIVINDNSQDDTDEVVATFKDPRISLIKFNSGGIIASVRNQGLNQARGTWIAFLDSDDWWYPEKLATVKIYVDKYQPDLLYHHLDVYTNSSKGPQKTIQVPTLKKPVFVTMLTTGRSPANSSVVVRRNLVDQVGGLTEDPALVSSEDFDLWLKIARITDRFMCIPQTLGAYWAGGGNITDASDRQIKRIEAAYLRHLEALSPADRHQAELTLSYISGKMKYHMNRPEEALPLLTKSLGSGLWEIKLKTLFYLARTVLAKWRSPSSTT